MRFIIPLILIAQILAAETVTEDQQIARSAIPVLTATESMQELLYSGHFYSSQSDRQKIDTLLRQLFGRNGNEFTYIANLTLNPEEAFVSKQGNCLTFAMLFITLAREIGLNAVFNEVEVSPNWNMEGGVIIETGHINVLVKSGKQQYVIEWLDYYKDLSNRYIKPISDVRALSYYFNNIGILALADHDYERSGMLLEEAIDLDPSNADAWQNYGVYWVHRNELDRAENAFLQGLKVAGKHSSIYFLLSNFYEKKGDSIRAKKYLKKGEKYAKKNPFYHYSKALGAKAKGDLKMALKHLNISIQKLPDYHLFHYEIAECYYMMGKIDSWKQEMEQAIQSTDSVETRARYRHKIREKLSQLNL